VNACSKKGHVIVSSTRRDEGNSAGFAEAFILDESRFIPLQAQNTPCYQRNSLPPY